MQNKMRETKIMISLNDRFGRQMMYFRDYKINFLRSAGQQSLQ